MKKILSLLLVFGVMFSVVACSTTNNDKDGEETPASQGEQHDVSDESEEIVIGALAPLTGDVSQYGQAVDNGARLAVEDINARGGILGKKIKYIVEDEQGEPTEAIAAYTKLYENDKIVALLGDVTTKPTLAVAQKAAIDGIPMITATATGEEVTQAGENIFRACFIDPYQGQLMSHYVKDKFDAKKVAVLYDTGDDYSSGIADAFKAQSEVLGIEVVNFEGYASKTDDFNSQLTLIKGSNPDVIMLPCYYSDSAKIISQARTLGIDAIFVGADGWDGIQKQLDESNYDVLENTYYCSQYSRQSDKQELIDFMTRYKETYGIDENMFAVLGYDSMMILADSIERAGSVEPGAIVKAMAATEYSGLTGVTTFDENRNPIREAYITTFKNGEPTVLESYVF